LTQVSQLLETSRAVSVLTLSQYWYCWQFVSPAGSHKTLLGSCLPLHLTHLSSWTLDFPFEQNSSHHVKFNTVFTNSLKSSATKFRSHLRQMDILNPKLFLVPACKVKAYNYSGSLNTTSRSFKFVDSDIRGCLADFSCTCRGQKKTLASEMHLN